MNKTSAGDPYKTWVYGKATPGWHVARWIWNAEYAKHLESLGYEVQRSIENPTNQQQEA
jgi:hypothetical protein